MVNLMRDRFSRMDEVIKYLSEILQDNELNDEELHNFVYYTITREGVSDQDKEIDFFHDGTFDKIVRDFNGKSTKVFINPAWKYYCQFKYREEEFYNSEEEMKIYVPVDRENMYRAVTAIFNFLGENDIPHVSNVGKNVRCDGIINRFKRPKDVSDYLEFLRDEKRVRGIIDPNPFAYSLNGIAMVCDGSLSYNGVITDILCKYLSISNAEHSLGRTSVDEFIEFVKSYFIEHFINRQNLDEVIGDITLIEDNDNSLETNKLLVNVKNIIELFLKGLDEKFGLPNFIEEYNARCDINAINNEAISYKNARSKSSSSKLSIVDKFLFRAIDIIMQKTRHNEDEAIENGMNIKRCTNYEKSALNVINCYLSTGNVNYLTRADNLRATAEEFDFSTKLKERMESSSLEDYYSKMKEIKQDSDLKTAIMATYEKYQKKYESGFSEYDGIEFVSYSINQLLVKGNYDGFTRDGNVRYELSKFTKPKDVERMIEQVLGRKPQDMNDITTFASEIIKKNDHRF